MKRITIILLVVLSGHLSSIAQTDTVSYGVIKNMPVFDGMGKLPCPQVRQMAFAGT